MKKAIIFVFALIFALACVPPVPAGASYNQVLDKEKFYSDIILLQSLDNGMVLFDKNADMRTAPASLTKIVVASIALEKCADLEAVVTVPAYAIRMLDGTDSSNAGLKPGENISVLNLLYCLLVPSANEAATILADYISGGMEAFVALMNERVKELGCENTNFVNPHGLDEEGQYTTANDMLKIVKHAMTFPVFNQITATQTFTLPATNLSGERQLRSTVHLMNKGIKDYYYEYATGIKTGSTDNAGRCVISKASKDGYSYLAVIMRAPFIDIDDDDVMENCAIIDCKALFKWTFANIRLRTVAEINQIIGEVPVKLSWQADHVKLIPKEEYTALMPAGDGAGSVLIEIIPESLPASIDAPVKKGQAIAEARVLYAGEEIARITLAAKDDVSRNVLLYAWSLLKRAASTPLFKIIAVFVLLGAAAYAALYIRYKIRSKKRKKLKVLNYRDINRK